MKIKQLILASAVTALAACASNAAQEPTRAPVQTQPQVQAPATAAGLVAGGSQTFVCKNGMTAKVAYFLDKAEDRNNAIELSVDTIGSTVRLPQAVSGSGERYASDNGFYNKATEWHQKGNEAFFAFADPYGNKTETTCRGKK